MIKWNDNALRFIEIMSDIDRCVMSFNFSFAGWGVFPSDVQVKVCLEDTPGG